MFQGGVDVSPKNGPTIGRALGRFMVLAMLGLLALSAHARMQFDVFLGYGDGPSGMVRSGNWFPVGIEVHHDGPSFTGVIEISGGTSGSSLIRQTVVELPTNTRKRMVIPAFHKGGYATWSIRLLNEKGKTLAEHENLQATSALSIDGLAVGSVARTFQGAPKFPGIEEKWNQYRPGVGRIQTSFFPDNPIALGGLNAIYLSSSQASKLSQPQVEALVSWMNAGGRLVVAIEQSSDVSGAPWLRDLIPAEVKGMSTVNDAGEIEDAIVQRPQNRKQDYWISATDVDSSSKAKMTKDVSFRNSSFPMAGLSPKGKVLYSIGGKPAVVEGSIGRGSVVVLGFSPERAPFRNWKNISWFWASIMELPGNVFLKDRDQNYVSNQALDGVFGYMVDSRQVRKLPVEWLFVLLIGYLAVIGPIDYIVLKKLNKQMLTWITFPVYVVLFSVLIYWIGFALRAGEIEWNEVHVVDVMGAGDKAVLKGRTFGSVYSPSNSRYEFTSTQRFASIRDEYSQYGGGMESGRSRVVHSGDGFNANVFVPVWTSQMFVTDWWEARKAPLEAKVTLKGASITGAVRNTSDKAVNKASLVIKNKIYDLGQLAPGEIKQLDLKLNKGKSLDSTVAESASRFNQAVTQRNNTFGRQNFGLFHSNDSAAIAASLMSVIGETEFNQYGNNYNVTFGSERDFDLGSLLNRDQALVFGWCENGRPTAGMNQFEPRRFGTSTLYRLAVPIADQ